MKKLYGYLTAAFVAAAMLISCVSEKTSFAPEGGAHENPHVLYQVLDTTLVRELGTLEKQSGAALAAGRYKKFRAMGLDAVRKERT